jgi:predicted acylesterase/phospholipase RssA
MTTTGGRYDSAKLECDLVMKGGITSGVVYPLAVCRVAEKYRLCNIGGASAGAIAAVAAGAAEYGRATGNRRDSAGFAGLETLPEKLTAEVGPEKRPRLLSLFQPTDRASAIFALLLAAIGKAPAWQKVLRALAIVFAAHPHGAVLGLIAGAGLIASSDAGASEPLRAIVAICGALALLLLGVLGSIAVFAWKSLKALGPEANFGICSGFTRDAVEPALTQWLTEIVDQLAGLDGASGPITFGDLAHQNIKLSLMTTDLTHGRPYRLPFGASDVSSFFFKKSDFDRLFPATVVAKMIEGAVPRDGDYYPFPEVAHLPLVVGARMSLSFPILLQAVPLYAIDWTLKSNQDGSPVLERCWFSDGGICSNMPIHFFDALLPGRPTFALSLKGEHPDYPVVLPPFRDGQSERTNVWIPKNNSAGTAAIWNRFDQGAPAIPLFSFLRAMIDTMQCWNDNLTILHPGYRDRIVHISHTDDEGGLNLNMPREVIERLARRGAAAGEALTEKFDPATGDGWHNHLWVRYRVLMAMLSDQAEPMMKALDPNRSPSLLQLFADPPSYKLEASQQPIAARANDSLLALANDLGVEGALAERAPHPRTDLRGRPRSG